MKKYIFTLKKYYDILGASKINVIFLKNFQGGIIMQMKSIQREILKNKKRHGFNTTNIEQEFCRLYGEVGEAYDAYYKGTDNFAEELADVAIFLMGIAEIEGINLEEEILKKVEKNKTRKYKRNEKGNMVHL